MTSARFLLVLATVGAVQRAAPTAHAQITLRAALAEADRAGYANRIATGNTATQRAEALAPLKAILPSIRAEAGYMRSNDPTVLGGATMRAVTNYPAGIVVEQPLLNADAWVGRRAALHAAGATYAAEEWARLSTRVDVVRAYYGAVLASERVTALQAAARAAHAHVAQTEAMVKQGLVTKSDALLASVRSGDVDAQLAEAEGVAATTQRQLAIVLGRSGDDVPNDFIRAKQLPPTGRIRAEVAGDTVLRAGDSRADVRAATDALAAARGEVRRAKASLLPRLNGFVRYDWSSPSGLYAGDRRSTVGVMGSWIPFGGASELADVEATTGRARVAEAQAEAARANALVEIEQTRIALSVALTRLDIAERAATQSAEAHRIVSRKYSGGLAGVVELLDAQAVETQSALGLSQARWAAIVAAAERRRALGLDPASLATLDDASAVATHDARPGR